MPGRLEFEFPLAGRGAAPRANEDSAMRILVIADLAGRGQRRAAAERGLAERPTPAIDVDNFDDLMQRLSPRLDLPLPGVADSSVAIEFRDLEDFHPDQLYRRLDLFKGLRELRARLLDPAAFPAAAAELRDVARHRALDASAQAAPAPTSEPATDEPDADTFARLLGGAPVAAPRPSPAAGAVASLIQQVVAPHIVPDADPFQDIYLQSVDESIAEQMRSILHHPAFQALEGAWRGVHELITGVETGEELSIHLLDATRLELLQDVAAARQDLTRSGLYKRLVERGVQSADGEPWSLVVCDFDFGAGPEDIALLAGLGAVAAQAGGPVLAAAKPQALGCESLADTPDPADWATLAGEDGQRWQALRASPIAPWIGLALPRVMARLPYGRDTEEIDSFDFEELPPDRPHNGYLWGNPAFACARLIAGAFVNRGWAMQPGDLLDVEGLPAHTYQADGERHMQAGAEIYLSERGAEALLGRGIMALMSYRNRNAARVARFQSIADPPSALAGPWS